MQNTQLTQLSQAIENLTQRVAQLEQQLGSQTSKQQSGVQSQPTVQKAKVDTTSTKSQAIPSPIQSKTPITRPTTPAIGGSWLGYVGVLFFILAASLFIKLAIDSGWLTPLRQWASTVVFSGLLIAAGFRFKEKDKAYAGLLPAAGIAILFVAGYAGHLYYGLYGGLTATLLLGAVALCSLYLFNVFKHDYFLIAAMLGSYSVPFLVEVTQPTSLTSQTIYYLFWNILYCYLAVRLEKRLLIVLAAYLGLGVFQFTTVSGYYGEELNRITLPAVIIQAIQFLFFCLATVYYSIKNRAALTAGEAWAFFPVLLLFYSIEYLLLQNLYPQATPYIALGFSALLLAIYTLAKKALAKETLESAPMLSAFIALNIGHVLYLNLLPEQLKPWFALGLIALIGFIGKVNFPYSRFWVTYFIVYAVIGYEYLNLLDTSASHLTWENAILNSIYFAVFFYVYLSAAANRPNALILVAAYLQALLGLNRLSELWISSSNNAYLTSTLWAIFALGNLIYASRVKDQVIARFSVAIFGIVAAKVLFIDVTSYDGISRIIALILVGGLLYIAGLILRKINSWDASIK